jgi:membrane protease YdiL (CAAX protease family)
MIVGRNSNYLSPPPSSSPVKGEEKNGISGWTLVICVAAVLAVELAARVVIATTPYHPMLILGCARLLQILLIVLIVLFWGSGLSSVGLARASLVPGIKRGLIWSLGFGVVAGFVFGVLFSAGINVLTAIQARLPTQHSDVILYFLVGALVGPVAEELFFRGLLYGFFRRWGVVAAVILSTLLFVLPHAIHQRIPITQVVGGIVFAVAYEVEGSLMVPIIIHVLGNMAIFAISLWA